jgi:hypothetical protein
MTQQYPNNGMQLADATFRRDLPELLQSDVGRWVAYFGDLRLGIFDSKPAAFDACAATVLSDECLIDVIEPLMDDLIAGPGVSNDAGTFAN